MNNKAISMHLFKAKRKAFPSVCLLVFLSLFSACEKVIDVHFTPADTKLVIEGVVPFAFGEVPEVHISQTQNVTDSTSFNGVSGADVSVAVNNDVHYLFTEVSPGVYRSRRNFAGAPGNTYTLAVNVDNQTYTATSVLPAQLVSLDSLWAEALVFGGDENITIYPQYTDPAGLGNSYRLVEYRNGEQVKHVFVQNDELSDGLTITRPMVNPDSELQRGDTVQVDLQCIDAGVYKYWYSVDQSATGANQSAAPANPVSNISGGALGYFSAYSVSTRVMIIP